MRRSDGVRAGLIVSTLVVAASIAVPRGSVAEIDDERSYDPPPPDPTPVVGLHDYATPVAPAPTATPTPSPSVPPDRQRPKRRSAAGHTSSGSGARTIRRPNHNLVGKASWHATGRDGYYAAACRPLRQAIGSDWRGRRVIVEYRGRFRGVILNDWCGSRDKTIDLSDEAFRWFAPLSRGVIRVAVGW